MLGFIGLVLLADFPEKAYKGNLVPFLTKAESELIVARIEMDRADTTPMPFNIGEYLRNALDLKVWGFSFIFMMTTTVAYASVHLVLTYRQMLTASQDQLLPSNHPAVKYGIQRCALPDLGRTALPCFCRRHVLSGVICRQASYSQSHHHDQRMPRLDWPSTIGLHFQ